MALSIVIVGHVDHGKSTLIGRLLYDSENIPEDKLAEVQKLLEEYKKKFEFAYFLDSFEEELEEERTIDTSRVLFKGKDYYTVMDVPGHKEFIKNMLTGASHAQVAILVVSASDGVQEQTRRHTFLLHLLGIKKIIVAINKMDLFDYREDVFHEIVQETTRLISSVGYCGVDFIPISALEGDNVYKPSRRMAWYRGSTLIQSLDAMELEEASEKALRFVVQDCYTFDGEKTVVGRLESGTLWRGDDIVFRPSGVTGKVEKIKVFPDEVEAAISGDSIGIVIGGEVRRGNVGGFPDSPPTPTERFLGEVVLLEGTLRQGDEFEIKCGTMVVRCLVREIRERINSETGEMMQDNPKEIHENEAATIVFEADPLVIERFAEIPELGRFVLVRKHKHVAAGVVLEVGA